MIKSLFIYPINDLSIAIVILKLYEKLVEINVQN